MAVIVILGLVIFAASTIAWVQSQAISTSIICEIGNIRNEHTVELVDPLLARTCKGLKEIRESFMPVIWLGGITGLIGIVGLACICRKKTTESVQQAGAGYPPQGVGSPDP